MIPNWVVLIVTLVGASTTLAMVYHTRRSKTNWFWAWVALLMWNFGRFTYYLEEVLMGRFI